MSIDEIIRQARVDCDDPNFSPSKELSPGSVRHLAPGPKAAKSGKCKTETPNGIQCCKKFHNVAHGVRASARKMF